MSNAQEIIMEIDNYLDKFMLKKSKLTKKDLIEFIEEKWTQADDGKFEIHMASIIIGRMINEYSAIKDVENTKRWITMMEHHEISKGHPAYINNYYRGEYCLKCGAEQDALKYLKLCYDENPEYIFTQGKASLAFLSKHLNISEPLPSLAKEKEPFSDTIRLPVWEKFFAEEEKEISYDIGGDSPKYKLSKNHKTGLKYLIDNQQAILTSILTELFRRYPGMQEEYAYKGEEQNDFMPGITKLDDFANLLSPVSIHILSVVKEGIPYIGYEFWCSWDREHGLGIMMYQDRVVEMGEADCSFLSWIAKNDLKSQRAK